MLWIHVASGVLALAAGAGALLTVKGGFRHRRFGRVYVAAMTVVAATALALYPLGPSADRLLLALVAVFSYYFVFSGYRALGRAAPGAPAEPPDWAGVGVLGLASVGLLAVGALAAARGGGFAPVLLAFGGIGTAFAAVDLRAFRHPAAVDRHWALAHLTRMGAGYIATVTAFVTVNLTAVPPLVRWLGPTAIGTLGITLAVRRYRPRFAPDA